MALSFFFTESNQNIFQTLLREGVRRNTNLLIGLVSCHYATAKHVCAENTQAGEERSIARATEPVKRREDSVMFTSVDKQRETKLTKYNRVNFYTVFDKETFV